MKIGEVAERTGTAASALRYYEQIGLLPEPERISGQRVYEEDVLDNLEAIAVAQDLGFTLEEIKLLLEALRGAEDPSEKCRAMAEQKLRELEELLANAKRMKQMLEHGLNCVCTSLHGCYISDVVNDDDG